MSTPIRRSTLTTGSKIMLPLYPMFLLYVGFGYRFGDERRTLGPSFDFARDVASIRTWGLLFIAVGGVIVIGYLVGFIGRTRTVAIGGLLLGAALCIWWAYAFAKSLDAITYGPILPSLNGWVVWSFIAAAFTASASSLALDGADHAR